MRERYDSLDVRAHHLHFPIAVQPAEGPGRPEPGIVDQHLGSETAVGDPLEEPVARGLVGDIAGKHLRPDPVALAQLGR